MNISREAPTSSTAVFVARTIFIGLNASAIVLANVLNIIILNQARIGSEPARIYISSLALADILIGVLAFLSIIPSTYDDFPFGDKVCQIAGSIFAIGLLLSVLFLAFISIDRFIAVTRALVYERLLTPKRAFSSVLVAWFGTSSIVVIVIVIRPDIMSYNRATLFCEPAFEDPDFPVVLFTLVIVWIVTCGLIMTVTYSHLFRVAHRHSRRIAAQELAATAAAVHGGRIRRNTISRKDMKAVRMCLAVTLAFNIAWVPTICLDFYKFIAKSNAVSGVEFAITWISLSNSWWNFLIYSGMNKQFRDAAKQLARKVLMNCRRRNSGRFPTDPNISVQGSSRNQETNRDQGCRPRDGICPTVSV